MSEPTDKLDMGSLGEALDHEQAGTTEAKTSEEHARDTMNKSSTLTAETSGSPETLSPSPSRSVSPDAATVSRAEAHEQGAFPRHSTTRPTDSPGEAQTDQTTQNIKAIFPDLDTDTIQAVVVAAGGDFERAINTLLQMSDPSYVPPPPAKGSTQAERDEQLARSIASQEEDQAQQRPRPPSMSHSSRGGGLGSLFSSGNEREAQSPAYDPTGLTYRPRVRRTTSGQAPSRTSSDQSVPQRPSPSNESALAGWPGPKEAKAWQEDINRFAETGFAKAASTLSALRQRGEQAWQGAGQQGGRGQGGATGAGRYAGQSAAPGVGSMFSGWAQRRGNSTMSPAMGSGKGFDHDASPVGENELANVLARGRSSGEAGQKGAVYRSGSPVSAVSGAGHKSSASNVADRYKKVASATGGTGRTPSGMAPPTYSEEQESDNDLSWDDAGRTGEKRPFEPIKVKEAAAGSSSEQVDNISQHNNASSAPSAQHRSAVSLMEASTGRGISSPKPTPGGAKGHEEEEDDLEYVANPFEDED